MNPMLTDLLDWTGCKWVDSVPGRMGGVPCLLGTRVDGDCVLVNFDSGMTVDELCEDYGLDREAVEGVLLFAKRLPSRVAA